MHPIPAPVLALPDGAVVVASKSSHPRLSGRRSRNSTPWLILDSTAGPPSCSGQLSIDRDCNPHNFSVSSPGSVGPRDYLGSLAACRPEPRRASPPLLLARQSAHGANKISDLASPGNRLGGIAGVLKVVPVTLRGTPRRLDKLGAELTYKNRYDETPPRRRALDNFQ
jgi:hypothetical protein